MRIISLRPLRSLRETLLLLSLFAVAPAMAGDTPPAFARYKPLYPGLYFTGGYQQDDRDSVYTQDGTEVNTVAPNAGGTGTTAFPETRYEADFTWFFPMWEADDFPFFSSRLHTARVRLRHSEIETRGRLAQFAADASDDTFTDRPFPCCL